MLKPPMYTICFSPITLYLWNFLLKGSSKPQRGWFITSSVASSNSPVGGRSFTLWKTLMNTRKSNICKVMKKKTFPTSCVESIALTDPDLTADVTGSVFSVEIAIIYFTWGLQWPPLGNEGPVYRWAHSGSRTASNKPVHVWENNKAVMCDRDKSTNLAGK